MPDTPDLAVSVAALAGTVAALNTRLALTEGRVNGAADRAAVEDLAERFTELVKEVTEALARAPQGPPAINWAALDTKARADMLGQLDQWVAKVLRSCYPDAGLRECWKAHPQVVIELGNLWVAWLQVYRPKRPDIRLALEWHDRWMPNAARRIENITQDCLATCKGRPVS